MPQTKVICFGEVLWDILPDEILPGGAPMNVAYHLNRLGKKTKLISKIGNDENGRKLLEFMTRNEIPTSFVQQDHTNPTGTVIATEGDNHEMRYEIVKPAAYDFIGHTNETEEQVSNSEYFVFGSLAARHEHSRKSLLNYIEAANTNVLDINIRMPHLDRGVAEMLLNKAGILKLNENELDIVNEWYADLSLFEDKVRTVSDRYAIPQIIITKGADGAAYFNGEKFFYHPGYEVEVADTIGSGDSFLAGFLSQLMENEPPEKCLEFACRLGSFIASQRGGCPNYKVEGGEVKAVYDDRMVQ